MKTLAPAPSEDDRLVHLKVQAEKYRRSLAQFSKAAWKILEPNRVVDWNWHHDLICNHLEAATAGKLRKLIINIPPRCSKSTLVSVLWPAWVWTREPGTQFLAGTYGANLALRDGRRMRNLVQSPWYQIRFGDEVAVQGLEEWDNLQGATLAQGQRAKSRFENEAAGYRVSVSIGGSGTGEGGDVLILDDPLKAEEAENEKAREEIEQFVGTTWSTRHNDPKASVDVLIMQRLHPQDTTQHLLDLWDDVVHMVLPMHFDPERAYKSHWGNDPRTEPGELLHPSRMPEPVIKALEKSLLNPEAQLEQTPVARGTGHLNRGMFEFVDAPPASATIGWSRYWDKAGTEGGDGSATAGVLLGVDYERGITYIWDVVRGRWHTDTRNRIIKQTAELDAKRIPPVGPLVFTEQEPGSGGKESAQATIRELAQYPAFADRPTGQKAVRAQPFIAQARAGNVKLVRGDWNEAFLKEMDRWSPLEAGDCDQVDASAGAYNLLWSEDYMGLALSVRQDPNREEILDPDDYGMFGGLGDDDIMGSFI